MKTRIRSLNRWMLATNEEQHASFVYFIQVVPDGQIKIGATINPHTRLQALQSSSPIALKLIGYMRGGNRLEKVLHSIFAQDRHHGEWFLPSDALLAWIRGRAQELEGATTC